MRDIDAVLDRWDEYGGVFDSRPRLIGALAGGLTNRSFLIEADGERLVLRLHSGRDAVFGIDRERERAILADAAAAGIAPPVRYHSVGRGILISAYIDGAGFEPSGEDELLELAARIHALATDVPAEDYYAHAALYRERLRDARIPLPRPLQGLDATIAGDRAGGAGIHTGNTICHRDLNRANVIERDGQVYVIDWEYATRGAASFDFAALVVEWDLDRAAVAGRTGVGSDELDRAIRLYRYTCELWRLLDAHEVS